MVFPYSYGFPMVFLWFSYGLPEGKWAWDHIYHGFSMAGRWPHQAARHIEDLNVASVHRSTGGINGRRLEDDLATSFLGRVLPVKKWTVNMVYYGLLWFTMVSPGNWDLSEEV